MGLPAARTPHVVSRGPGVAPVGRAQNRLAGDPPKRVQTGDGRGPPTSLLRARASVSGDRAVTTPSPNPEQSVTYPPHVTSMALKYGARRAEQHCPQALAGWIVAGSLMPGVQFRGQHG